MTKAVLLEALKKFTLEATKDLQLPLAPREEESLLPPQYGPPGVYRMRLPEFGAATRKAPYILHQVVTGKDAQKEGERLPDSSTVVRTVFCVYCGDEEEGGLLLLNVMERLRIALLEQVVIGKQFKLDLKAGLESLAYPDDGSPNMAPYYLGEMVSTWKLPGIQRRIGCDKEEHFSGGSRACGGSR